MAVAPLLVLIDPIFPESFYTGSGPRTLDPLARRAKGARLFAGGKPKVGSRTIESFVSLFVS